MEVLVAKQTGRRYAVKPRGVITLGICALILPGVLSGCADTAWYNSHKNAQEAKADIAKCNAQAEDATLSRARRQRADYNPVPTPGTMPGLSRGETPVQLAERSSNERDFGRQLEDCMESKGYSRGKDKNQ